MTDTSSHSSPLQASLLAALSCVRGEDAVVGGSASDDGASVRVMSYARDFEYAWGLSAGADLLDWVLVGTDDGNWKGKPSERTVVVAADGVPRDASMIDVGRFIGPPDWALLFSTCLLRRLQKELRPAPDLRILIVDPRHEASAEGGERRSGFGITMPWVQCYGPASRSRIPHPGGGQASDIALARAALPWGAVGVATCEFVNDVMYPSRILSVAQAMARAVDQRDPGRYQAHLRGARTVWAASVVSPTNRHHVGNLVGPMILAEGMGRPDLVVASPTRQALRKILIEFDALGESAGAVDGMDGAAPLDKPPELPAIALSTPVLSKKERDGRVFGDKSRDVLLVDDQFRLGYHQVVGDLLFGVGSSQGGRDGKTGWSLEIRGSGRLECHDSPSSLLRLLKFKEAPDWSLPHVLAGVDVLLLDLRLYTSRVGRQDFFSNVLEALEPHALETLGEIDSFVKSALVEAQTFSAGRVGNEIVALTLLPLVVSYYDPSLPIVLFSSTQQRLVSYRVAHRPSIITSFSKPTPAGRGYGRAPREWTNELAMALEKALERADARAVWKAIEGLAIVRKGLEGVFGGPPDVKRHLARLYERYVTTDRHFDLISIPAEYIEANLGEGAAYSDMFTIHATRDAADALRLLRNRKAHGYEVAHGPTDKGDTYRASGLLAFRLYVALVSASAHTVCEDLKTRLDIALSGKKCPIGLGQSPEQAFVNSQKIEWNEFSAWALAWATRHQQTLGTEFNDALRQFVDRLFPLVSMKMAAPPTGTIGGTITYINKVKQFGFIAGEDKSDYHCPNFGCEDGVFDKLEIGTRVVFRAIRTRDGRPSARGVRKA